MPYLPDLSFGPDTRIVLVGTTKCPLDEVMLPPVPHAERNIDYLSRLFTDPAICGLDSSCIVRVLDRDHANEITVEIARAAQEATDTLLVYYVGHGLYGDAETPIFLASCKTTEAGKAFNGVSINLVRKAMKSSRARKRILILDCCYSGRAIEGGLAPQSVEATLAPAIDIEGTFGIAAVPANAKALAPPDEKLTRFTGALVDVLEHGFDTKDAVLTLEDVFKEVERKIGRKADAPLPKQINWDKGEKFVIARNRFLHRRELDELYVAIEALRETMAATGARLQALEAKGTDLGDLPARVAAIEASAKSARPASTPPSKGQSVFQRVDLSEADWDRLPAQPFKVQVRRYFLGRRNALYLIGGIIYLGSPAILGAAGAFGKSYDLARYIYALAVFLTLLSIALSATIFLDRIAPRATASKWPADIDKILRSNEHLSEIMDKRVIGFFGIYLDVSLASLSVLLALLAAVVSVWLTMMRAAPL